MCASACGRGARRTGKKVPVGRQIKRKRGSYLALSWRYIIEALEERRLLSVVAWDGGGDGVSWGDRLNWTNDQLPAPTDDAMIDAPIGTIGVASAVTVTSISSNRPLAVSSAVLVTDQLTAPALSLSSGSVLTSFTSTTTQMHK